MGMFNYVVCKLPLPDGWEHCGDRHDGFQTKSIFPLDLDTYVIEEDMKLYRIDPYVSEPVFLDKFRGEIEFYTHVIKDGVEVPEGGFPHPSDYDWKHYQATFVKGICVVLNVKKDIIKEGPGVTRNER